MARLKPTKWKGPLVSPQCGWCWYWEKYPDGTVEDSAGAGICRHPVPPTVIGGKPVVLKWEGCPIRLADAPPCEGYAVRGTLANG